MGSGAQWAAKRRREWQPRHRAIIAFAWHCFPYGAPRDELIADVMEEVKTTRRSIAAAIRSLDHANLIEATPDRIFLQWCAAEAFAVLGVFPWDHID